MAALQYLESLRSAHPELADWYNSLADLYQKKLWHQLTLKLEQFVALAVFQVSLFFFPFLFLLTALVLSHSFHCQLLQNFDTLRPRFVFVVR